MWHVALLGLLAVPPGADSGVTAGGVTIEGEAFGPQRTMTCIWFTNFENSRLETCSAEGESLLERGEGASIRSQPETWRQLDADARRIAHWTQPDPVWGIFTLRILGRIGAAHRAPRYLGDGTRTVLIEKLLSIAKAR